MNPIDDVRPLATAEPDHVNGGSLPLAVAAGGFLAACIWTGIAWDLPPGATAQEAGEKLGLGRLL
jgi:hypothetical protein